MAEYGKEAHELVAEELHKLKEGKLRSGSGQKVTNPKQAIAIALSEARREGVKTPHAPAGTASAAKEPADRRAAKKAVPAKSVAKKAPAGKSSK